MERRRITIGGILQKRDLARVTVLGIPDRPGVAGAIFDALGEGGINCSFIVHTIDSQDLDTIVLCVAREQLGRALCALTRVTDEIGAEGVVHRGEVALVSVFGPHFGDRPGVAGVMFSALASVGINIQAISTSISSLTCLLDASDLDAAVRALEEAFEGP
jgi:aspartate kinase